MGRGLYIHEVGERAKVKKLKEFDAGKVVEVCSEEYHADGMDWANHYYSDGTIDRSCYGYTD